MTARVRATAAMLGVTLALCACAPEPAAAPTTTGSASSPATSPAPTRTATPTPEPSQPTFAVPAECADLYSPDMLARLQAEVPPLNDPGVTLYSTQTAVGLELLGSGIPTLRCSWGAAGEAGLATNVSVIDADRAASLPQALAAEGFGCEPYADGVLCRTEREVLDLDDNIVTTGEAHFVRGTGWVSTAYIDAYPDGYAEDVVATLWD